MIIITWPSNKTRPLTLYKNVSTGPEEQDVVDVTHQTELMYRAESAWLMCLCVSYNKQNQAYSEPSERLRWVKPGQTASVCSDSTIRLFLNQTIGLTSQNKTLTRENLGGGWRGGWMPASSASLTNLQVLCLCRAIFSLCLLATGTLSAVSQHPVRDVTTRCGQPTCLRRRKRFQSSLEIRKKKKKQSKKRLRPQTTLICLQQRCLRRPIRAGSTSWFTSCQSSNKLLILSN